MVRKFRSVGTFGTSAMTGSSAALLSRSDISRQPDSVAVTRRDLLDEHPSIGMDRMHSVNRNPMTNRVERPVGFPGARIWWENEVKTAPSGECRRPTSGRYAM